VSFSVAVLVGVLGLVRVAVTVIVAETLLVALCVVDVEKALVVDSVMEKEVDDDRVVVTDRVRDIVTVASSDRVPGDLESACDAVGVDDEEGERDGFALRVRLRDGDCVHTAVIEVVCERIALLLTVLVEDTVRVVVSVCVGDALGVWVNDLVFDGDTDVDFDPLYAAVSVCVAATETVVVVDDVIDNVSVCVSVIAVVSEDDREGLLLVVLLFVCGNVADVELDVSWDKVCVSVALGW